MYLCAWCACLQVCWQARFMLGRFYSYFSHFSSRKMSHLGQALEDIRTSASQFALWLHCLCLLSMEVQGGARPTQPFYGSWELSSGLYICMATALCTLCLYGGKWGKASACTWWRQRVWKTLEWELWGLWATQCGFWETNSGLLKEKCVLLIVETSLHAFKRKFILLL